MPDGRRGFAGIPGRHYVHTIADLRQTGRRILLGTPAPVRRWMAPVAWRAYEWGSARRAPRWAGDGPDGLPIPPARLRIKVSRGRDPESFLRSGREEALAIRRVFAEAGKPVDASTSLLDFGCGCGRVLRNFVDLGEVKGCDADEELVGWVAANLPFATVETNGPRPPVPWTGFDLIYALSVFTHLDGQAQIAWIEELHRALNPGGLLLFTTQGERFRPRMEPAEKALFEAGELAVRFPEGQGSNLCSAYHPDAYLDRMLERFERVRDYAGDIPDVSRGSVLRLQDVHLVRKRERSASRSSRPSTGLPRDDEGPAEAGPSRPSY